MARGWVLVVGSKNKLISRSFRSHAPNEEAHIDTAGASMNERRLKVSAQSERAAVGRTWGRSKRDRIGGNGTSQCLCSCW